MLWLRLICILVCWKFFKEKGKKAQCFHGKGLISLILPDDFYYEKKNNAHPDEPTVKTFE